MTKNQKHARNEAYQLLSIAERILKDSNLSLYAHQISIIRSEWKSDNVEIIKEAQREKFGA